jgi:hypothetical protein
MSYSDSVSRRGVLILDTGPIRELVTYHAVHEFRFEGLRRELKHFHSPESYRNCTAFLALFQKKITSASVVAELSWWIRDTDRGRPDHLNERPDGQIRLWGRVREEFQKMGMDETVVKLLDMDIELVAKYGPTDVSLLGIAQLNNRQHPTILTLDDRLRAECRKAQIPSASLLEACLGTW